MAKSIKIGNLKYHDVSRESGMVECKCRVGDGWQGLEKVTLLDYDESDTLAVVGDAVCRLGAHQEGAWWLIVVTPTDLVPDVVEQGDLERFAQARESQE